MTAVERRQPMEEVCETIASPTFKRRLAEGLPENVSVDRFTRTALTAIQANPELITADRQSLYLAIIRLAQDGLMPDGREAALVIFKSKGGMKVQAMPMVLGLRKKAAEYGFSLSAYTVHQGDTFTYVLGMNPSVTHEPPPLGTDRGEILGAYAVAKERATGDQFLDVMDRAEIEKVRSVSRAATSEYGPWANWYGEMAQKTVVRRLYKSLPFAAQPDVVRLVESSDAEYELGLEGAMTVDDANLHVSLEAGIPADDNPPDDGVEWADAQAEEQYELTFKEQAEAAQRKRVAKGAYDE